MVLNRSSNNLIAYRCRCDLLGYKLLNPRIVSIGNIYLPGRIHKHTDGFIKLSDSVTFCTKNIDHVSMPSKLLNTIIVSIYHKKVVLSVYENARWFFKLPHIGTGMPYALN